MNRFFEIAVLITAISILSNTGLAQRPNPGNSKQQAIQTEMLKLKTTQNVLQTELKDNLKETAALNSNRAAMFEAQDAIGVSNESFGEVMKSLHTQRVELAIDLVGLNARRAALLKAREKLNRETAEHVDPLTKILELEKQALLQAEKHKLSSEIITNAKRRVLTAELRIAEARSSSTSMLRLNSNLLDTLLEKAEKQARLEKVEALLKTLTSSRDILEQFSLLELKISNNQLKQQQLQNEIQSTKTQIHFLEKN